jgi:putative transcriptional regulator
MALWVPALFPGNSVSRAVQYSAQERVTVGNVLIANEKLDDPNFAQSVILIVQFDKDHGTVGLMINRRTQIPVSRVFPKAKQATGDPVYMGGPLEITGAQALLRLSEKATQAAQVTGDVYVTASKELIENSVTSQSDPAKFRLYLGYAGWGPGQVEAEIRAGAWSVISGDANIIFDGKPESLWSRLSHSQIASEGPAGEKAPPTTMRTTPDHLPHTRFWSPQSRNSLFR